MMMRKTQEETGKQLLNGCKSVLLGGAAALLLCIALLLLASAGVSQGFLPGEARYQITVVCCVLGSFIGTILAARTCPLAGVPTGLAVGAAFFLLLLSLGVLVYDTVSLENGGLGLLSGALCGGAAAGLLRGGRKTRSSKKRRPR